MTEQKTILLVDDDVEFVQSNQEMLEAFGYRVVTAHNGDEGMARALTHRPDLMILDIMMTHDTEGMDVARRVRTHEELANMRILMVSGIVAEKRLSTLPEPDSEWLPVERILEKPIDPPRLIAEVEKLLGTR